PPSRGAGALAADGRAPQATPDRLAAAAAGAAAGRTRPTDAAAPTTRRLWRTRCTDTWPAAAAQPNRRDRRRKGACAAALTARAPKAARTRAFGWSTSHPFKTPTRSGTGARA